MFQENLFKAQLKAKKKTVKDVAEAVGINEATLYRKINGTSDFTRNEIQLIRQYLNLCAEEVDEIFLPNNLCLSKNHTN